MGFGQKYKIPNSWEQNTLNYLGGYILTVRQRKCKIHKNASSYSDEKPTANDPEMEGGFSGGVCRQGGEVGGTSAVNLIGILVSRSFV